jgi:hypothetical protein
MIIMPHRQAAHRCSSQAKQTSGTPQASAAPAVSRWIKDATCHQEMPRTARRYRTTEIQAGPRIITAADPACRTTSGRAPIEPNRVRRRSSTRYRR